MSRESAVPKQPAGRLIGYAHVSTAHEDLTRQVRALKAERCDVIYTDVGSGETLPDRPGLELAIAELSAGDKLVMSGWDCCTRSMWDGLHIANHVLETGATIRFLDFPSLDFSTPEGRGFLTLFSAMAERERMRIMKRTHEGRRLAMARGVKMGRRPKLTAPQRKKAAERLAAGETTRAIARDYAVSRTTIAKLR
jgi:DNA invertase Pin-like site-specific DNA recombinase